MKNTSREVSALRERLCFHSGSASVLERPLTLIITARRRSGASWARVCASPPGDSGDSADGPSCM